jgi:hypothetical protein
LYLLDWEVEYFRVVSVFIFILSLMLASSFRVERLLGHLSIPFLITWVFLECIVCFYPRFISEEMVFVLMNFPSLYTGFAVYWEARHIFALLIPAEVQSK